MIVYLIRHGQTRYNRDGLGLGRDDAPLTPLGESQADALGRRFAPLRLDAVVASPLGRAVRTAEAVAGRRGVAVERVDELIELDVGETEGMGFAAVREAFPQFVAEWTGAHVADAVMPGGESLRDVAHRVDSFLGTLYARPQEQAVAVVSHNFVIKVLLCRLLGLELAAFRSFDIGLASVSTISIRNGRSMVVSLNDICHLAGLNLDRAGVSV